MDTDQLLQRVAAGEPAAAAALLTRHEARLRRMVEMRLDTRLASRLDPSDIVQDVMVEAHKRLATYAQQREIPFYPWLRAIAWDKLIEMNRRHIAAERRSVRREADRLDLSGDSELILVNRLAAATRTPNEQLIQREITARVRRAIEGLKPLDREVVVLRHLEELSFPETAAVLRLSEGAVYTRYRRAIERLHRVLHED
jgi:RNA polymerase sigma-70 factor, ECF subfamily